MAVDAAASLQLPRRAWSWTPVLSWMRAGTACVLLCFAPGLLAAQTSCEKLEQEDFRRPGLPVMRVEGEPGCPARSSRQSMILPDFVPVPDRWRLVSMLGYPENLWDPYSGNNWLKGDRPFWRDWFFNLTAVSDSVIEPRNFPVPVGNATTQSPGQLNLIGDGSGRVESQTLLLEFVLLKGDTTFRPPDYEFRLIPVVNLNRVHIGERGVLRANPRTGLQRRDHHIGWQGAFFDYHIRNVSDRYDFDSLRIGIQPFSSDFRGFLFQDQQLGVRVFGTRNNNIYQYNLGWFRRLEKDTNSGLNDLEANWRKDDVFIANLYRQDWPVLGYISQLTLAWNRNREGDELKYDANGFILRPASLGMERLREYDVLYLGYNGDGHFGRWNLTTSAYAAIGDESRGVFVPGKTQIRAGFAALELSRDYSWIRPRLSVLWGSGDADPFDNRAEGFDAIFENPQFAGGDTSFLIRQGLPLVGGGRVALSGRNGILNSLRSSKEQGQSNFSNPGIRLIGLGADLDLMPELRVSFNANQVWFDQTEVLETARNQAGISRNLGQDLSISSIWRPYMTQNIFLRVSAAWLVPGSGFEALYGEADTPYSMLGNLVLQY